MSDGITRMSTQTAEYARASLVPTKDIEEAPWNVNVCPPERYAALKADLKTSGPKGTDPIHVCTLGGKQYTIDGAHRLRAAKELGWPVIYVYFHDEVATEEQARLFNYKRDAERGDIDPFKLATSFKWFQDAGMKQKDIAAKFGVDDTTVSHTLSLLRIEEHVKQKAAELPVSHLEVLAAAPAPVQDAALKRAAGVDGRMEGITLRDLQWAVNVEKREYDAVQALQKALTDPRAKPEFRECPVCKAAPDRIPEGWHYPKGAVLPVACKNYHAWSLATGAFPKKRSTSSSSGGRAAIPQHFKSKVKTSAYVLAVQTFFDKMWPRLTDVVGITWEGPLSKTGASVTLKARDLKGKDFIYQISVQGKLEGRPVDLSCSAEEDAFAEVLMQLGQGAPVDFKFEENGTDNKGFATYVRTSRSIATKQALHALEEAAVDFLEEYGGLPRGKNPDWERIQKRQRATK